MGDYSIRVKAQHESQHLSPEQIRANKCSRSHSRNVERMAVRRERAEARNKLTKPENRREFRRANKLKEFAV